jgi:hypothetical protein
MAAPFVDKFVIGKLARAVTGSFLTTFTQLIGVTTFARLVMVSTLRVVLYGVFAHHFSTYTWRLKCLQCTHCIMSKTTKLFQTNCENSMAIKDCGINSDSFAWF